MIQIVCCPLSPLQTVCYESVLGSKLAKQIANGKETRVLNTILGACGTNAGTRDTRPRPLSFARVPSTPFRLEEAM